MQHRLAFRQVLYSAGRPKKVPFLDANAFLKSSRKVFMCMGSVSVSI